MEQIQAVYVNEKEAKVIKFEAKLEEYKRLLDCRVIDIQTRRIGKIKKHFDFICDDEGTMMDYPNISAINNLGNIMFVGKLLITNHDDEGRLTSLSDDEAEYILNKCMFLETVKGKEMIMVTQVEY